MSEILTEPLEHNQVLEFFLPTRRDISMVGEYKVLFVNEKDRDQRDDTADAGKDEADGDRTWGLEGDLAVIDTIVGRVIDHPQPDEHSGSL